MGRTGGRRAVGYVVAALAASALSGCNSGSPDVSAPSTAQSSGTSAASNPSSTGSTTLSATSGAAPTSGTASSGATLGQEELTAKIAAGAPPKNLTWRYPAPPKSWKRLKTDRGTMQWQVNSRCVVTLGQPAGLGTAASPDSEDVLEHTAEQNATALPGKPEPTYHDRKSRMVANFVDGLNGTSEVKMQESLVDYGTSVRSRIVAYRAGDFALTAVSVCGTPRLFASASKSEMDPFINTLQARTTY